MKVRTAAIAVSAAAAAAAALAIVGSGAGAIAPTVVVSTPSAPNGWGTEDTAPAYVVGPAGTDGNGSLKFVTVVNADKVNIYHAATGALSTVTEAAYSELNTGTGAQASFQIQITGALAPDGVSTVPFTSLVWEPYQQPGHGSEVSGDGHWHSYGALELGYWWSSHPILGNAGGQSAPVKLSAIVAAQPNAQLFAYGVGQGSFNPNSTSYIDDVEFNNVRTNFEVALQPTTLTVAPLYNKTTHKYTHKLSATLTSTAGSVPISGERIFFSAGGLGQCSAVTNAAGVATCKPGAGGWTVVLNNGYKATFNGDDTWAASGRSGLAG